MADIRRLPDGLHRRRTHPHMETHHHKLSIAYVFPISINGASPVETQNLASPVLPIPIYSCNKPLSITAYTLVRRKILRLYFCRQRISSLNPAFHTPRHPPCATTVLKTACQQTQLSRFSTALPSSHGNVWIIEINSVINRIICKFIHKIQ